LTTSFSRPELSSEHTHALILYSLTAFNWNL